MPASPCDDRPSELRTRLETALVRLHRTLDNTSARGAAMDSLFAEWQSRWASRRDDIVRRLEAIDSQLDRSLPINGAPRLSLVTSADETG